MRGTVVGIADLFRKNYYEYCKRCNANLTLQKGFRNELPYWKCRGCGEMLINPAVSADDNIAWICDKCEAMLNIQDGFTADCGEWTCTECGFSNSINSSEVYLTDDEYQQELNNPYRGICDEDLLELLKYEEIRPINNRSNVILVNCSDNGQSDLFVKKILSTYDLSVYDYLIKHPVLNMPRIYGAYKSDKFLIVIEEYIKGELLSDIISRGAISVDTALDITKQLLVILNNLHSLPKPIIHRDVKPANVIISSEGEVYLLDMNVAKWYKAEEIEDTRLLGTPHFAAPEQFGFGWHSSSDKADIYSVGVLLNLMVTGKLPKVKRAEGMVWDIVEKCICMEPDERYSARELLELLEG